MIRSSGFKASHGEIDLSAVRTVDRHGASGRAFAPREVDAQVAGDGIDPLPEGVLRIVAREVEIGFDIGLLDDVPGILFVAALAERGGIDLPPVTLEEGGVTGGVSGQRLFDELLVGHLFGGHIHSRWLGLGCDRSTGAVRRAAPAGRGSGRPPAGAVRPPDGRSCGP